MQIISTATSMRSSLASRNANPCSAPQTLNPRDPRGLQNLLNSSNHQNHIDDGKNLVSNRRICMKPGEFGRSRTRHPDQGHPSQGWLKAFRLRPSLPLSLSLSFSCLQYASFVPLLSDVDRYTKAKRGLAAGTSCCTSRVCPGFGGRSLGTGRVLSRPRTRKLPLPLRCEKSFRDGFVLAFCGASEYKQPLMLATPNLCAGGTGTRVF